MKIFNGESKALLRAAAADLLPDSILRRGKSAFPSIQDPGYDQGLIARLNASIQNHDGSLTSYIDPVALQQLGAKSDTGSFSDLERILVESAERLSRWIDTYAVELDIRENRSL